MSAQTAAPQPRPNGNLKHGHCAGGRRSKEHMIWTAMKQRCFNPKCNVYKYYGGRGIKVCRRWLGPNGFVNFLRDVGPKPQGRFSLNRKDNAGDYGPANVEWADPRKQSRSRRSNRRLTYRGETMPLVDWAARRGIKPVTLVARLNRRWGVKKALTTPVAPRKPYTQWAPRKKKGGTP